VQVPVGHPGDDAVADREATVAAGGDLVLADVAGGLEEPVGEPVELAAHGVAPVHDGMLLAGFVGGNQRASRSRQTENPVIRAPVQAPDEMYRDARWITGVWVPRRAESLPRRGQVLGAVMLLDSAMANNASSR
jgi:hypothetical protein